MKKKFAVMIAVLYSIYAFGQSGKTVIDDLIIQKIDVYGSVFMVNGKDKKQVPVVIETDSTGNSYYIVDEVVAKFLTNSSGGGFYFKYKTSNYDVGSIEMYYSIREKNIQRVNNLLNSGYDITLPIFLKDFYDFRTENDLAARIINNGGTVNMSDFWAKRDEDGYIIASAMPIPAIKTTALEYAKKINDPEIITILSNELEKRQTQRMIKRREDSLRYSRISDIKDSLLKAGYKEIIPGKGFDSFEVGKTTFEEIINKLGPNCEIRKIEKNDYEIRYNDLGLAFYCDSRNKSGILTSISIKSPFKGVTSEGIELNKSDLKEIYKFYGIPVLHETESYSYWSYNGIRFYKEVGSTKILEKKIMKIEILKKSN